MSEQAAERRDSRSGIGSCLLIAFKTVVVLLAVVGAAVLIGPCGLDTEFSLDSSNTFVVAFHEPRTRVSGLRATHAAGRWTLATLHDRLGEIGFDFEDEWNPSWSRVILFEPYTQQSAFHAAGVVDPAVASGLADMAYRDGGLHLVAFDRWQPRTIIAHFYISLDDFEGPVLVIDPEDVSLPTEHKAAPGVPR